LGLVLALIGVAAYFIFFRQPVSEATQLGLDLKGGVSANLRGYHSDGSEVTREEMDTAAGVIRQRIDALGVAEPEVQTQGNDQIIANIPGITDTQQAVDTIGRTAQLGFYEVLASTNPQTVDKNGVDAAKRDLRSQLESDPEYQSGTKILFEESPSPQGSGTQVTGYIVPENPGVKGDAIQSAAINRDQTGKRNVAITLTDQGTPQFGDFSQQVIDDAVANGKPGNGQIAVVLDEDVISAPRVQQALDQGRFQIENQGLPQGLPQEEAKQLEVVLKSGALPVNMEVLSVSSIGPTLGTDSLQSGLLAAVLGFALVLMFLIAVYRVLGLVADLALLIYAFLLWGLIVAIPITVTLPGIAGIVLSIGVAADANVVIFERIKEEIRRGKTPRTAIGLGYQKGFRAILDGNLTTLITAFILFALSSGSVRGFAVLLAVGVILSMFTAIAVTRALLGLISGGGFNLSAVMVGVSKGSIAASAKKGSAEAAGARR
jgi:preprotein translocase subunit SecD